MKKQINKEKQHITQSTINKRHKSKVNQNKNELHFNNEINHETKIKRKENEKNKIHNTNEQCKQNINNLNNINKANNSKNNKNKKKHIEKSLKKSNCSISEISIVLPNQNKSANLNEDTLIYTPIENTKENENKKITTKENNCKKCKQFINIVDKEGIFVDICKNCNMKKQINKEKQHLTPSTLNKRHKSTVNQNKNELHFNNEINHETKRKRKENEKNKIHNMNEQCKQNINNLSNINKVNNSTNKKMHIEKSIKKSNCPISEISIVLPNKNKSVNLNEDTLIYTPIENTKKNENKKITTKENICKKCKQIINIVDKEGIFVDICTNCDMKKQIEKEKKHITRSTLNEKHKSTVNKNKKEIHFYYEINNETKRKMKENEKNNTNKQNVNNLNNNINKVDDSNNNENKNKIHQEGNITFLQMCEQYDMREKLYKYSIL